MQGACLTPPRRVALALDPGDALSNAAVLAHEWSRALGAELFSCTSLADPTASDPVERLVRLAAEWGSDLLVTSADGDLAQAEAIAEHAPCSVLVARGGSGTGPVIAATDLSPASENAVALARELAARLGLPLAVVHASSPGAPPTATAGHAPAGLEELLLRAGIRPAVASVVAGKPSEALWMVARQTRASVLVVAGSNGRLGCVARKVVRDAPCSVLVARLPAPGRWPGRRL